MNFDLQECCIKPLEEAGYEVKFLEEDFYEISLPEESATFTFYEDESYLTFASFYELTHYAKLHVSETHEYISKLNSEAYMAKFIPNFEEGIIDVECSILKSFDGEVLMSFIDNIWGDDSRLLPFSFESSRLFILVSMEDESADPLAEWD